MRLLIALFATGCAGSLAMPKTPEWACARLCAKAAPWTRLAIENGPKACECRTIRDKGERNVGPDVTVECEPSCEVAAMELDRKPK